MSMNLQFKIVDLLDTPVFNCADTSIPGSASSPRQVVASLAGDVSRVAVFDGTARYIGLYRGAVGSEVIAGIIGGGTVYYQEIILRRGDRISVRNLDSDTISTKSFCMQFLALDQ